MLPLKKEEKRKLVLTTTPHMSSGGVWHDDDMEPFEDGGPGGQTGAGGFLVGGGV